MASLKFENIIDSLSYELTTATGTVFVAAVLTWKKTKKSRACVKQIRRLSL